jgi:hypothetical protein
MTSRRGTFSAVALAVSMLFSGVSPASAQSGGDNEVARASGMVIPALNAVRAAALLDLTSDKLSNTAHRGPSGKVRALVRMPGERLRLLDELPAGVHAAFVPADASSPVAVNELPDSPGAWIVQLRAGAVTRTVPDLVVLTAQPIKAKKNGRIGRYVLGDWPYEKQRAPGSSTYAPPVGLIEVTPQNRNVYVSEHFRLGDLITKGQDAVWPKYIALTMPLLDKVELTLAELESMGHPVHHAGIISAFRTPEYNLNGGDPAGRGDLSRHVYGDAMDLYIDNDRNGRMDDLNRDGRVDRKDAQVLASAAERVEKAYPQLIGGIGIYNPRPGAHSGFVHIDARGFRARW